MTRAYEKARTRYESLPMTRNLQPVDLNAYVKHKYHGRYEDVSGSDLELLDYSRIERWVSSGSLPKLAIAYAASQSPLLSVWS